LRRRQRAEALARGPLEPLAVIGVRYVDQRTRALAE
jgi:hypothetical protein